MSLGKLYGVGIGIGSSDLMTLRAVEAINSADVIAIQRFDMNSVPEALRVVKPNLKPKGEQEFLYLDLPHSMNSELLEFAWHKAGADLYKILKKGKNIALLCEGDPLLFGIYDYLDEQLLAADPTIEKYIIPGVSCITAIPAVLNTVIAEGDERIAVLSAAYELDDLPEIIDLFDTILLTELTHSLAEIIAILEKKNQLHNAVYVNRAAMVGQKIVTDLATLDDQNDDYFSMIMIKTKNREQVLRELS